MVTRYEDKRLNGPNDVWVRPDGALYFADPFCDRMWWTHHAMPQDGQHVYFLSANRRRLACVADDLQKPNGISGTPDGKTLYVADIGAGRTFRMTSRLTTASPARRWRRITNRVFSLMITMR